DLKSTILFNPLIYAIDYEQHARLSVKFQGGNDQDFRMIGIVDNSRKPTDEFFPGQIEQSIGYDGLNGRIYNDFRSIQQIEKFDNGDIVTLDVYLPSVLNEKGERDQNFEEKQIMVFTVKKFDKDIEQNEKVQNVTRFYAGSSVEILELFCMKESFSPNLEGKRTFKMK
ncbi:MAG: hypothetical protein EZS28_047932, partial [Streblomastix strix]